MKFQDLLAKYNGGISNGSQTKLARALGISHVSVSGWVNGRSLPGEEMQLKLAKLLGISVSDLLDALKKSRTLRMSEKHGGNSGMTDLPPGAEFIQVQPIRVIGVVSAGSFECPVDGPPEELLMVNTPPGYKPSDVFGLRVSGDCMEPTARSGDYAIIAKATEAHDGQLCIVRVDSECTFKRVFKKGTDCVELRPDNPHFKPIRCAAKHAHIVGKVLGFYRKP